MPDRKPVTPKRAAEWAAVLPVYVGLIGLVACFLVWMVTGQVNAAILGAFGSLVGIGQGADVLVQLNKKPTEGED